MFLQFFRFIFPRHF